MEDYRNKATFRVNESNGRNGRCPYYAFPTSLTDVTEFTILGLISRSAHQTSGKVLQLVSEDDADWSTIRRHTIENVQNMKSYDKFDSLLSSFIATLISDSTNRSSYDVICKYISELLLGHYSIKIHSDTLDAVKSRALHYYNVPNDAPKHAPNPDPSDIVKSRLIAFRYYDDNVSLIFEIGQCGMVAALLLKMFETIDDPICPLCSINRHDLQVPLNRHISASDYQDTNATYITLVPNDYKIGTQRIVARSILSKFGVGLSTRHCMGRHVVIDLLLRVICPIKKMMLQRHPARYYECNDCKSSVNLTSLDAKKLGKIVKKEDKAMTQV